MDISDLELFQSLMDVEIEGKNYDLHNEFNLVQVSYLIEDGVLCLDFNSVDNLSKIQIVFKFVVLRKISLNYRENEGPLVIDGFYRGRWLAGNELVEISQDSKGCIYIDFLNGSSIEVLAKEMAARIQV